MLNNRVFGACLLLSVTLRIKNMRKIISAILLFIPFCCAAQNFTKSEIMRFKNEARAVTIIRDNWGIPHIYGKTDADAVFGLMYAECE